MKNTRKRQEVDITGECFGKLIALRFSHKHGVNRYWLFQCDCGGQKAIQKSSVTRGISSSCGCGIKENNKKNPNALRHGDACNGKVKRLHSIWRGMLKRVDATIGQAYEKYAARGIGVAEEWREYEPFRDWSLANGYADDLTLDREDNDGDYGPGNCRWVGWKQQANNRRSSRRIEAFGITRTLQEWADHTGIKAETISARIALRWSSEKAVTQPVR